MRRRNFDIRIQIEAGVPFFPFLRPSKSFWIFQLAGRAAAKYDKIASYIAAAIKILAEDSEDDTDHEDTPTPPTFTLQLFLDSLFFMLLEPRNEPGVPSYSDWSLSYSDWSLFFIASANKNLADEITWITWNYLQNLEIISYPNSYRDIQLRAKCRKIDPATGVTPVAGSTFWHFAISSMSRYELGYAIISRFCK